MVAEKAKKENKDTFLGFRAHQFTKDKLMNEAAKNNMSLSSFILMTLDRALYETVYLSEPEVEIIIREAVSKGVSYADIEVLISLFRNTLQRIANEGGGNQNGS